MASRIIAYVLMTATQVFGRAFAQAYRQAASSGARGGAQETHKAHKTAKQAAETISTRASRRSGMTLDEAHQILNVKPEASAQQILDNFDHLFKVNDKSKGGSFYLQSKVFRAKQTFEDLAPERIEVEVLKTDAPKEAPSSADSSSPNKKET
eukprot:m.99720 g.99720  ORF g.99720 m.99720 type:complete len:152 (+) comp9032_c0_seq13:45-500(+)